LLLVLDILYLIVNEWAPCLGMMKYEGSRMKNGGEKWVN
jgi:hypothetical protein